MRGRSRSCSRTSRAQHGLARRAGARFGELLDRHRAILRRACEEGVEFGSAGDACVFAFRAAGTGVTAAGNAQRLMETWKWPAQGRVRVRIGVHTGEAEVLGESYVGVELHRAARICQAGHGGQVLVSDATVAELGSSALGFTFRSLGEHMLKDFERPQQLYQLTGVGLADRFDPPRTNIAEPEPLPREASRLIGRRDDLVRVAQLIERTRLVTLTGTGGSGKTRLALRAAWNAKPVWPGPVAFVPMMQLDRVDQVPAVAGRALGRADTITTWEQIIDLFSQRAGLIVFDNAEHLEGVSERMAVLRDLTPALTLIITSRSPLQLDGEQVFPVDPLTTADAVELLVDRVSLHLNGYDPNEAEREDLMVIAERLGGLPLALELAAARLRGMSAGALRERLDRQLDLLSGGRVDVPERQRTMRAAIAWSFDLLRASDQAMLSELSLFAAPATLDAIARVNGAGEAEAIDGLTRLIDASLVRLRAADGRYWLLEPVRQFAAERLVAEFDQATAARARFCDWYYETATSFFDQDADAFQEYDNAVLFFSGEVENTVRALAYLTDAGEWDRAVRLVFDALGVIDMFGASDITSEWVAEARANGRFVSQRSAAMVAILAAEMGPYPGALATHLEAVAACRSADEPWLLRIALRDLAFVALDQAELDVAEGAIRDYAETELVTPYHLMLREILRGRFAMLCERPDEGAAHLRAAEQIARRSDEQFLVAKCLRETAKGYLCGGDADAALFPLRRVSRRLTEAACRWSISSVG